MTYLNAEQAVTMLLTTKQINPSWLVTEAQASLVNNVLTGTAHDIECGCDDSTVAHLIEWRADWLATHSGADVPEPRAV